MKKRYRTSAAIAWQSYEVVDLLIILKRDTGEFFFFQESGRFIINYILQEKDIDMILNECMQKYDVAQKYIKESVNRFILLLRQEEIIYECSETI